MSSSITMIDESLHLKWVEVKGSNRSRVFVDAQHKSVLCPFHKLCCIIPENHIICLEMIIRSKLTWI